MKAGTAAAVTAVLTIALLGAWLAVEHDVDTVIVPPDAVLPDGARYFGDTENGKFHGRGRLIWPNGRRYEGGFAGGLAGGEGELRYASGDRYTGEFADGVFEGRGRLETVTGDVYEGRFADDMFNGIGTMTTYDGVVYSGEFTDNVFTGHGAYTDDRRGERYEGEFLNWRFHGQGQYTVEETGETWRGTFENGDFVKGLYTDGEGNVYEGAFTDWQLSGEGRYTGTGGETYTGEFRGGLFHGKGTLVTADGDRYTGEFQYGRKHGEGTLVFAEPRDSVEMLSGEWRYGEYVDPEADEKAAVRRERIERALYTQNELLQQAAGSVAEGDPEKIELYFAGVAGYSDQDVFLKEVRFIRDLLDKQYETAGRSVILANHTDTLDDTPLATRLSMERTLSAVAEKMNPDQDILFIYLTSHGSENHELHLQQNGLALPDLSAERFGEIVKALPVKWKVVAVSACFSGGFIPHLAGDDTLVMTAAAKDRTSFGCSDTSDMTYFGRAYFKESLPEADSFEEAFRQAVKLIEEWENEDMEKDKEIEHSKPQIAIGARIGEYLPKWRADKHSAVGSE